VRSGVERGQLRSRRSSANDNRTYTISVFAGIDLLKGVRFKGFSMDMVSVQTRTFSVAELKERLQQVLASHDKHRREIGESIWI
jgi:DNA-binding transcriptional MerR regulator